MLGRQIKEIFGDKDPTGSGTEWLSGFLSAFSGLLGNFSRLSFCSTPSSEFMSRGTHFDDGGSWVFEVVPKVALCTPH